MVHQLINWLSNNHLIQSNTKWSGEILTIFLCDIFIWKMKDGRKIEDDLGVTFYTSVQLLYQWG